jgi:hypothetical protein
MFLFFRNAAEDFQYMLDGYRNGVLTEERLQEALERILGLKATLGLHTIPRDELVPGPEALSVIGSAAPRRRGGHRQQDRDALNQPNHLIDVPMVKTMVHAHNPSREAIHAAVQKITGTPEFTGTFNENVWCDTWGTRL